MPKIVELKEIDGVLWARLGAVGDFPSGVALWTPEEQRAQFDAGYRAALDAVNNATATLLSGRLR